MHIDVREKDIAVTNRLTFSMQGTRDGQPIKLDKVEVSRADTTIDPSQQSLAALADIAVNVQSPFLQIQGGESAAGQAGHDRQIRF